MHRLNFSYKKYRADTFRLFLKRTYVTSFTRYSSTSTRVQVNAFGHSEFHTRVFPVINILPMAHATIKKDYCSNLFQ